jgi:hypothetical protein
MVQSLPTAPFEVIEPEFLFHLLVPLFAAPPSLDPGGENWQRRICRQVAQVVFVLARASPFPNKPHFVAWSGRVVTLRRTISHPDPGRGKLRPQWPFGASAPCDLAPGCRLHHDFRSDRFLTGDGALARSSGLGHRPSQFDRRGVNGLRAGHAHGPGEMARAQPLPELGAVTVAGISDNHVKADAQG